ncbi:hypothetical protein [Novosphingobium sp. CECT 9465]|uniref:hypothetical protein n=1 Tax=Novosphingobium sp. CECT 9465 TaxID=2829794 RepID=UPI001E38F4DB|nr:hypothetical protein [Novosphingobium sp. CECT 9465]CAH0495839.1 hypothetical protein NVSP9465_00859 [Novosphingobium sp. CECT 9465]
MSDQIPFERSVFVNCPFDEDFAPLLQAIAFCLTTLGFYPRLAPENADNALNRLERIIDLVKTSKYGIHDLSRCMSAEAGEYARMNMPFELGLDHGRVRFGEEYLSTKSILILEKTKYDYQKTLSDISGWDIEPHNGDHIKAVRVVRNWLVQQASAVPIGPAKIQGDYLTFQEWYWERELERGASDDDIKDYPTVQIVQAMREWVDLGKPDQWQSE